MSSLISSRNSDSGLQAQLHPLVLLTISDHITRHALRDRKTPIVGAILGQQNGRQITLEHAFECDMISDEAEGGYKFNQSWFEDRLQQYKDVHKDPPLDLTGWFALSLATGLLQEHAKYQKQMEVYNESVLFLAFEPTAILEGKTVGGKLPLVVYESVYETVTEHRDKDAMVIDGQSQSGLQARFRELPYSVETGEAEMISVDFVAKGGGNATEIEVQSKDQGKGQASQAPVGEGQSSKKGGREQDDGVSAQEDTSYLSLEDDELITSLTTRANAVKMLYSRISLLKSYLTSLPPCYLNDPTKPHTTDAEINHPLLRSIQSLVARLPLLLPPDRDSFQNESTGEQQDVNLVKLLGEVGKSIKDARELGANFAAMNRIKQEKKKGAGGFRNDAEDAGGDEAIDVLST